MDLSGGLDLGLYVGHCFNLLGGLRLGPSTDRWAENTVVSSALGQIIVIRPPREVMDFGMAEDGRLASDVLETSHSELITATHQERRSYKLHQLETPLSATIKTGSPLFGAG